MKRLVLALLFVVTIPALEADAGLFFRQGRGLFPNARGVAGRVESRQSRRVSRRSYRRSGYGFFGYHACSSCNRTRANAVLVD